MFIENKKTILENRHSKMVAFLEFIAFPVAASIVASSWVSPGQPVTPSLNIVEFGPGALFALPEHKIIPSLNGKFEPFLLKYPFELPER